MKSREFEILKDALVEFFCDELHASISELEVVKELDFPDFIDIAMAYQKEPNVLYHAFVAKNKHGKWEGHLYKGSLRWYVEDENDKE